MTYDPDVMDTYITAEVLLPRGDLMKLGKVIRRLTNENNLPTGQAHGNPILDTREYAFKFDDGEQLEYAAIVIAENIYAQVDAKGRKYMLMDSIIDHRKDESAVAKDDEYVVVNGKRNRKKTTDGWQFNIQWKDDSTTWEPLKTLKEANPVEIADYVIGIKIVSKPAFAWWVPFRIQKRDQIIAAVNKRYLSRTHKIGIVVPKPVAEALDLDKNSGKTHWQ
jgi:hypothetical protein